jgi:hypothetical protein
MCDTGLVNDAIQLSPGVQQHQFKLSDQWDTRPRTAV